MVRLVPAGPLSQENVRPSIGNSSTPAPSILRGTRGSFLTYMYTTYTHLQGCIKHRQLNSIGPTPRIRPAVTPGSWIQHITSNLRAEHLKRHHRSGAFSDTDSYTSGSPHIRTWILGGNPISAVLLTVVSAFADPCLLQSTSIQAFWDI